MSTTHATADVIELTRGFEIDLEEAWRKIISRQFAGPPGRAFGELIVNFIDSYPAHTPWEERAAAIESGLGHVSITDWGEGMSRERLRLLLTLGGSDKRGDDSKIGRFGIGFFAIFNPELGTTKVTITTRCEGSIVTIVLDVLEPGALPTVSMASGGEDHGFSTRIQVEFDRSTSVAACLAHARERLEYYPCPVTIDGVPHESAWLRAQRESLQTFQRGAVRGFVQERGGLTILCRYQLVMKTALAAVLSGARDQLDDLRDFRDRHFPFLPDAGAVVDCSDLRLTISRDSFYCDAAYHRMLDALREALLEKLSNLLRDPRMDPIERTRIILTNQYTLSSSLGEHVRHTLGRGGRRQMHAELLDDLASAKVYRINGRAEPVSLLEIATQRSRELPVFFSPTQSNLRWMGGAFKHDFVVLPVACDLGGGAPDFYSVLFKEVFEDIVDLDTIKNDKNRVAELVARGIVSRDALGAQCKIVPDLEVPQAEAELLDEINDILATDVVRDSVRKNLALRVRRVRAAYFEIEEDAARVSAGLFGGDGTLVDRLPKVPIARDVTLGLRLDHPLIREMARSKGPHRAYYALTFLSHELARCQELLVPDTPAFYFVKSALARDMRRGLTRQLLRAA